MLQWEYAHCGNVNNTYIHTKQGDEFENQIIRSAMRSACYYPRRCRGLYIIILRQSDESYWYSTGKIYVQESIDSVTLNYIGRYEILTTTCLHYHRIL